MELIMEPTVKTFEQELDMSFKTSTTIALGGKVSKIHGTYINNTGATEHWSHITQGLRVWGLLTAVQQGSMSHSLYAIHPNRVPVLLTPTGCPM